MARQRAGLALALAICSACAGAVAPPFTPPEAGGPGWTKFTSPHFVIHTDLPAREGLAAAEEFERMYATLADIGFPFATRPGGRTRVLVLRNQAEFDVIGPIGAAGFYRPRADELLRAPSLVLHGSMSRDGRILAQHELTHRFVHYYYPGAPRWLNEGLAQYYSTMVIEDGKVVLGRPLDDQLFRPGTVWQVERRAHYFRVWVPTSVVPTVATLLASDGRDFSRRTDDPGLQYDDSRRVIANYAGAWALVHMLKSSPEPYPVGFEAFLLAISAGDDAAHAWGEAFAGADARLEVDYQAYLRRGETIVLRAEYEPPSPVIEHQETMSPAEVHLLWAAVRPTLERKRREIAAAYQLEPGAPEVALYRSRLAASDGKLAEAASLLRAAIAAKPKEERYVLALLRLLRRAEGPSVAQQIDDVVATLRQMARSADSLNDLGQVLLDRGQTEEAVALALRAIDADPSCFECYDTLAGAHFARGAVEQAIAAQTIALNVTPDGTRLPDMVARWEKYRAARRRAQP